MNNSRFYELEVRVENKQPTSFQKQKRKYEIQQRNRKYLLEKL